MTTAETLSIQEVARRTGFSDATLRYYERIGLIPPVPRDPSSGHRRHSFCVAERLEALACLRASGLGIAGMRRYLVGLDAGGLVALFGEHAADLGRQIAVLEQRWRYVDAKARLWQARLDGEADAARDAVDVVEQLRSWRR